MRMSFITNQIIKRNKKWKVYIYIYIYIYSYLINCEYFNNLNEDRDMARTGIMAGIFISPSPYPYPYPIEKIGDFPYPYPYPVNAGIPRPSKRRRVRVIPTGTGLFAISNFIIINFCFI